ncbi:MAG: hypothetical protein HC835_08705 [Oscillatoriales cyanobacterium RM2_1_1]|nr:hypothetical protein [Oscillatoriales cyanobacterium SM2_3_0]NJO45698.1 hypothetical protein [Oscillatoriales cyanobacterium RM2_1_1]
MILGALAFWISGSLILDLVVMPSMYITGMMTQSDFVSAGSVMFSLFNRVEMLCAAISLTGLLALAATLPEGFSDRLRTVTMLSLFLLGVTLICGYSLTPEMAGLGLSLNLFDVSEVAPEGMNQLHFQYWSLESLKLLTAGAIATWCLRAFKFAES